MYREEENLKKRSFFDNLLVYRIDFTCNVTDKTYKVRRDLSWDSANVEYLINCTKLLRVPKSDINTGKDRCVVGCDPLFCSK